VNFRVSWGQHQKQYELNISGKAEMYLSKQSTATLMRKMDTH